MKLRDLSFIAIFLALFSILALTAPSGSAGWSRIPADFRIPMLGFFTNLVLVAVTWFYVLITREQLKELQAAREPKAVLTARVPQFDSENITYGRGQRTYRTGPPVYLDVWNFGGPTIMVMRVTVRLEDYQPTRKSRFAPVTPQALVESGKVSSINIGYQLMDLVSPESEEMINFPDHTAADAHFTVHYFSLRGERSIEARYKFRFRVTDEHINTLIEDDAPGARSTLPGS